MVLSLILKVDQDKKNCILFRQPDFTKFIKVLNFCGVSNYKLDLREKKAGGKYGYYRCLETYHHNEEDDDDDDDATTNGDDGVRRCKGMITIYNSPSEAINPKKLFRVSHIEPCTSPTCIERMNRHLNGSNIDEQVLSMENGRLLRCPLKQVHEKVLLHIIKVRNVPIVGVYEYSPVYRDTAMRVFPEHKRDVNHFLYCELMNGKCFQLIIQRFGDKEQQRKESSSNYYYDANQQYVVLGLPPQPRIPYEPTTGGGGRCSSEFDEHSVGLLNGESMCFICLERRPLKQMYIMDCDCKEPAGSYCLECLQELFRRVPIEYNQAILHDVFIYDAAYSDRICGCCKKPGKKHCRQCNKQNEQGKYDDFPIPLKGYTTFIYNRPVDDLVSQFRRDDIFYTDEEIRHSFELYAEDQLCTITDDIVDFQVIINNIDDFISFDDIRKDMENFNNQDFVHQVLASLDRDRDRIFELELHKKGSEITKILSTHLRVLEGTIPDWAKDENFPLPDFVETVGDYLKNPRPTRREILHQQAAEEQVAEDDEEVVAVEEEHELGRGVRRAASRGVRSYAEDEAIYDSEVDTSEEEEKEDTGDDDYSPDESEQDEDDD